MVTVMFEVSVTSRFEKDDNTVAGVMQILGYTWVPKIISRLDHFGGLRYNEIRKSISGISTTSLSRSLALLEKKGIVHRDVENTTPPSVTYSLTDKGRELKNLIANMLDLGEKWHTVNGKFIEIKGPGKF
ncbi:MAG: helix-turn-helix domain-containing protein [Thermoplasmataceae archaeon]